MNNLIKIILSSVLLILGIVVSYLAGNVMMTLAGFITFGLCICTGKVYNLIIKKIKNKTKKESN